MAAVSFAGVYLITGKFRVAASILQTTAYNGVNDYIFAVIPLFVVMGLFATQSGATRDLFDAAEAMLRRVKGGVGAATVIANAIFAAITGVSVASAAVFSKLAIPEMNRLGYERKFGLGIVASSALLGMLIPPSILMIVYGVITEELIGRLFAAGIGPGLVVAGVLIATIFVWVRIDPGIVGREGTIDAGPDLTRAALIAKVLPIFALIALVLGGIYGGLFTPIEAGAIGALGALALILLRGRFTAQALMTMLLDTGKACASIFFLLITAQMYSRMLTLSRLPETLTTYASSLQVPGLAILLAFIVVLLILGCIIELGVDPAAHHADHGADRADARLRQGLVRHDRDPDDRARTADAAVRHGGVRHESVAAIRCADRGDIPRLRAVLRHAAHRGRAGDRVPADQPVHPACAARLDDHFCNRPTSIGNRRASTASRPFRRRAAARADVGDVDHVGRNPRHVVVAFEDAREHTDDRPRIRAGDRPVEQDRGPIAHAIAFAERGEDFADRRLRHLEANGSGRSVEQDLGAGRHGGGRRKRYAARCAGAAHPEGRGQVARHGLPCLRRSDCAPAWPDLFLRPKAAAGKYAPVDWCG